MSLDQEREGEEDVRSGSPDKGAKGERRTQGCEGNGKSHSNTQSALRIHPGNVKYVDYLESMRKRTKTIQGLSMIRRATASIRQYPLPIMSPMQFQLLEGIGNYLGSRLNRLLQGADRSESCSLDLEERTREYRMFKIDQLNKIVDPILDRRPEADNSLLEALESDAVSTQHGGPRGGRRQTDKKGEEACNYTPQAYGDRWCILVVLCLLEELRETVSHFTKSTIQDLCLYLRTRHQERMLIKNIDKSMRELVKMGYVNEVNSGDRVKGFPIKTENIRYGLTDIGRKTSVECCRGVSLFRYILENRDCARKDALKVGYLSVKDKIELLDDRKNRKAPFDCEVVMLMDYREVNSASTAGCLLKSSGISQNLLNRLRDQGLNIELKNLPVGDVIWVARPIYENNEKASIGESYVLPWIIERKTGSDMCSSIMDGRYEEQKYRLMRSLGAESVIYLLEDLNSIHENIICNVRSRFSSGGSSVVENVSRTRPMYKDWEHHSKKSSNLTVEEVFGRQLRSIKGCGPEATEALLAAWPTPYSMYKDMSRSSFDDVYSKLTERWSCSKDSGSFVVDGRKKLRPPVSKDLLRQLYCLYGGGESNSHGGGGFCLQRSDFVEGKSCANQDVFELKF
ncbi:hypothetical protein FG386_002864 [Cryptosporidium ryanae]|uniref:uncharacterized protein n=1 Tax=Cryptosporidium ryanae TaxID=515981 RepID=UPI00351AAE12|nr:hypothetical protein FG386_002864 [Cryptosporidium ryanae]